MATRATLYFNPGDDEIRVFQHHDSNGVIFNLTGYTALFTATVKGITETAVGTVDGVNGKVTVTVTNDQTANLGLCGTNGVYTVVVTSSGGLVATIAEGAVVLLLP